MKGSGRASRDRAVLRDYFLRGLTQDQIAAQRNLSLWRVRKLVEGANTRPWSVRYEQRRSA